ncbi:Holliday junction resolvase RuvX [Halothermothrix orenii]|uniref:Resolvase RNase H domain protein fold protein n=1 Tax=Halothermothrix orenii (strain H 168 / OCM 544 / DSM 9562) TaxID=373903 RepID=B8CYX7_HALOH|nr:Holliday junction resolvase RuvX [Halothermothrix orenii]ACL70496.1 Resolvase RNase H domain protein fold protein [Halothermothrix orenii H 168]
MVLAIDPGRDKCGIAVVDRNLKIFYRAIVSPGKLGSYLQKLSHRYSLEGIVLGNGTFSGEVKKIIEATVNIPVHEVDESYTTLEAEERYRQEHYTGWKVFLKFLGWKPACPLDDLVAVVLAGRYFQGKNAE